MTSATLSSVDERQFLTVNQPVLPLHKCADHAPTKFAIESLHSIADFAAAEEVVADPAAVESTIEPLHSTADPVGSGVALTETFYLCLRV
jgi:hypothetical protein